MYSQKVNFWNSTFISKSISLPYILTSHLLVQTNIFIKIPHKLPAIINSCIAIYKHGGINFCFVVFQKLLLETFDFILQFKKKNCITLFSCSVFKSESLKLRKCICLVHAVVFSSNQPFRRIITLHLTQELQIKSCIIL